MSEPVHRSLLSALWRSRFVVPAGALMALLTGCAAIGPDYRAPEPKVPAQWQGATAAANATTDAAKLARWWRHFHDPVLDRLVDDALKANVTLASARAKLREARARRNLAEANLGPSVSASGSASRSKSSGASSSGSTHNLYNAGFDASWEPDVFGGGRRSLEAAEADVQAQAEALHETRVSLAAEVARNYVDLRTAERQLAVAQSSLKAQSDTYDLVRWRRRAGLTTELAEVQALTQLEQTRLQLQTMKTDLARMDTLLKTGSVTQQSYDQTKSQVETTELVLENLEENTLLRAPYSGIITGKYYNDGELFSPTPNTQAGKAALVSMIQIDPVKLMVNLGEDDLPLVKNGMHATVQTDVYPDQPFQGTVFRIHPTVNAATRTFVVEVKVPNPNEKLRPGMFARVSVKLGEKEALMVPAISVLQTSGTNERYIMLNENGTARKVVVTIEKRYDDKLEISSPSIQGGEQLILAGHTNLEDGAPVKVVEE